MRLNAKKFLEVPKSNWSISLETEVTALMSGGLAASIPKKYKPLKRLMSGAKSNPL